MRIFNENKTQEIFNPNLELGYLRGDKLFVKHHEAIPFKFGKTAQQIAQELKAQGVSIEIGYDDKPYRILEETKSGGKVVEAIKDEPNIAAQDAYDEYEDIQVYVSYTAEELKDMLRAKRTSLLSAFDKWEKAVLRGREQDDYIIMDWYQSLLNLNETAFEDIPERIKYYL